MSDPESLPGSLPEKAKHALVAWFADEHPEYKPFGEGHINHTWLVDAKGGEFVLQRLSREVFPQPKHLAHNLDELFAVFAEDSEFDYLLPQPLPALDGRTLVTLNGADQHYFRLCRLIGGSRTLQRVSNVTQARSAGLAFGRFQRMAAALDQQKLQEVIPGFYKLSFYSESLTQALAARGELELAEARLYAELDARISRYGSKRDFEGYARVIHGDCKVNNLLFADDVDEVVAVLDLDTLMVGAWWLDFGDLVRSGSYDRDDEFRPEYYAALADGFFAGRGALKALELEVALRAPAHVAYMLAIRFFDDHLRGDQYFKVIEPGDNLRRAEAQFAQLLQLEAVETKYYMRSTLKALVE